MYGTRRRSFLYILWMRIWLAFAAIAFAGCGGNGNDLSGSLSEVYPLDFDDVTLQQEQSSLLISYNVHGGSVSIAAKLVVDLSGITVVGGQAIDLAQVVTNNQMRGILYRVDPGMTPLPIKTGQLVLDNPPVLNSTLSGHFNTTLSMPDGRTLNGDFRGTLTNPAGGSP